MSKHQIFVAVIGALNVALLVGAVVGIAALVD
jgi:hypothetical protein